MTRVIIESPYAGDVERNEAYLLRCLADSLSRDEAPFASHRMYTQVLDDLSPAQRTLGMETGFRWMAAAELVALYLDYGESSGMREGRERAEELGLPVVERFIGENP